MSRASDVLGAGAPVWVAGKIYKSGDVLKSPADRYQLYVRTGPAGGGATDPANDAANYVPFGGRAIKSVQRGVSVAGSVSISAINPGRSSVSLIGFPVVGDGVGGPIAVSIADSTHLAVISFGGLQAYWQVVEFY